LQAGRHGLVAGDTAGVSAYVKSGAPYVWLTAAAISVAFIITISLLCLTAVRGLPHFWPADLMRASYQEPGKPPQLLLAEIRSTEEVTSARLIGAGLEVSKDQPLYERLLLKIGNRDLGGVDFRYVLSDWLVERSEPKDAVVFERVEWGNFHGYLAALQQDGKLVASGEQAWQQYRERQERINDLRSKIRRIEKDRIGKINYELEHLRLEQRRLELDGKTPATHAAEFAALERRGQAGSQQYESLRVELDRLNTEMGRDTLLVKTVDGQEVTLPLSKLINGYRPNEMGLFAKTGFFFGKLWEFVSEEPREANTEGGIFPAIFGTVMMVMLMSVIVTPFGILAALYLREYAKQGALTQAIRIAVNNLAGVPSIVFGMFGLGFFVYAVGGS
ncbi:MAG: phosphate ABC transporter permease PstA, partial [Solimonas sp.]